MMILDDTEISLIKNFLIYSLITLIDLVLGFTLATPDHVMTIYQSLIISGVTIIFNFSWLIDLKNYREEKDEFFERSSL